MNIREAKVSELDSLKGIIDSAEEMDTDEYTYTIEYFRGLLKDDLVLVAIKDTAPESVVGVCFGKYDYEENWADMIGLAVREGYRSSGIGTQLVETFEEEIINRGISTIDLFADQSRSSFFDELGYEEGRTYVAFRKELE